MSTKRFAANVIRIWMFYGLLRAGLMAQAGTINLLGRYPTQLTAGDTAPDRARVWEFAETDVFRIDQFSIKVGSDFRVKAGPADLGVGHCADGAVWAVVIPRDGGLLIRQATNQEAVAHVWLRFHPRQINRLFPASTVFGEGATNLAAQMRVIASAKFTSSWHAGGNAMIPEMKDMTVDVDTKEGPRRFFSVNLQAQTATYWAAFEKRNVKPPVRVTPELAGSAFDQVWEAFDRDYAMFVLRPELDWAKSREQFHPRALASKSSYELGGVLADLLKPLRDLHVWLTVAGANVPVFNRPRAANSNPSAHGALLGKLQGKSRVQWAVTPDRIGFLAIYGWNSGPEIPAQCDEALEQMRGTRGLIVDVRLNGGGDEPTAAKVAGRFLANQFVYAYSQYRNGRSHTNLTEKFERTVAPRGPWRYDRPVVLLIGQKCMSSNESFIGMMTGDTNLTTMGDHTCGSSGNPRIVRLPLDMTVSVPRWIDYLPDGTPLDERGFQPQIRFQPKPGAFQGERDDLLAAALDRLRQEPVPAKPIEGPAFAPAEGEETAAPSRPVKALSAYAAAIKEEAQDPARPRAISVSPTTDAIVAAGLTDLRVRFDRPMDPLSLKLNWDSGGFTAHEFPKYDPEKYEFTIPVRLIAGAAHQIVLNRPGFALPDAKLGEERQRRPLDGFQSADHRLAGLFVWRFRTSAAIPASSAPVRATRISPASGSDVPILTLVEVQFAQPMAPPDEAMPCLVFRSHERRPEMIARVAYDAAQRTFRLPLVLPPKTKVQFTLTGFRTVDGVPAQPVTLDYQVTGQKVAAPLRAKTEADAKDPRLLALLDNVRQKRARLHSLAERVQTLTVSKSEGLFTQMDSKGSSFQWQQPDQFYGDASQMMMSCAAFRIGSDGRTWWWHYADGAGKRRLVVCPVTEIHTRNVSFCDPFDLTRRTSDRAAADLGLRLVGLDPGDNPGSCRLEAWDVSTDFGTSAWGQLTEWRIDPQSGLPTDVTTFHPFGVIQNRFLYEVVDQPLPETAFAPPKLEGVLSTSAEALDADYTTRFINLRDGSDGRMSVRWGKEGPKARSSSGLN